MSDAIEDSENNDDVKKIKPGMITARDIKLMELLGLYGCVSSKRIKDELFGPKENLRSHFRRIGILKRAGFIESVGGDNIKSIGYKLTKKGKEILELLSNKQTPIVPRKTYKTEFEHDQLLIDVRRILLKSPLVSDFRTEGEVKKEMLKTQTGVIDWKNLPHIPDATFHLKTTTTVRRIAVELELSRKSRARYRKIFRSHLLSNKWDIVFYIVKDEVLQKHLRQELVETKKTDTRIKVASSINGIYFCSLAEFQSKELFVKFSNGKQEVSIGEMGKTFQAEGKQVAHSSS